MDSDIDIGTLPISEWQFSVRHIFFQYRNNRCRCRISDIANIKIDVDAHLCAELTYSSFLNTLHPSYSITPCCPVTFRVTLWRKGEETSYLRRQDSPGQASHTPGRTNHSHGTALSAPGPALYTAAPKATLSLANVKVGAGPYCARFTFPYLKF